MAHDPAATHRARVLADKLDKKTVDAPASKGPPPTKTEGKDLDTGRVVYQPGLVDAGKPVYSRAQYKKELDGHYGEGNWQVKGAEKGSDEELAGMHALLAASNNKPSFEGRRTKMKVGTPDNAIGAAGTHSEVAVTLGNGKAVAEVARSRTSRADGRSAEEIQRSIESKYKVKLEAKKGAEWSKDDLVALDRSLGKLSARERKAIENTDIVRYDKLPSSKKKHKHGSTSEKAGHYDSNPGGRPEIGLTDAAFEDPHTAETTILHEVGHAIAHKNEGALKRYAPVRKKAGEVTTYSEETNSNSEHFAEAFALYKTDPEQLRKTHPDLHAHFAKKEHLEPNGFKFEGGGDDGVIDFEGSPF